MTCAEELAREIAAQNEISQNIADLHAEWALRAIAALAARGGPKLVRREPTEEMWRASEIADYEDEDWLDMHDAAPAIPEDAR